MAGQGSRGDRWAAARSPLDPNFTKNSVSPKKNSVSANFCSPFSGNDTVRSSRLLIEISSQLRGSAVALHRHAGWREGIGAARELKFDDWQTHDQGRLNSGNVSSE